VPEELGQVKEILKRSMENAYTLDVPLVVDMKEGKSWYETK
jgi:DNA polymerase I-like protein with 3'-5' exonuclease and polymerase domains